MARTTSPERLREQAENSLEAARKSAQKANDKYTKASERATAAGEALEKAKVERDEAATKVAQMEAFVNAFNAQPQTVSPNGTDSAEEHGEPGGSAEDEPQAALV